MTITTEHKERVLLLLKKDADRRAYQREYMKLYREKQAEKGIKQKQYNKDYDTHTYCYKSYHKKTVLEGIRFLFKE